MYKNGGWGRRKENALKSCERKKSQQMCELLFFFFFFHEDSVAHANTNTSTAFAETKAETMEDQLSHKCFYY